MTSTQLLQSTDLYDGLFFKVRKCGLRFTKTDTKGNKKPKLKFARGNKKFAYSFISKPQLSVQEAIYNILLEHWIRKCFLGISFINTKQPQNRIRMIKSKEELKGLSDDSTDVFKRNITDRYIDRLVYGKFACLKNVCRVKFAAYYYKKSVSENDYQSYILEEDINYKDINFLIKFPKKITLKNTHEVMIRRNQRLVLRYYKPNRKM